MCGTAQKKWEGDIPNAKVIEGKVGAGAAGDREDLIPLVFRVCMFGSRTLQIEFDGSENDEGEEEEGDDENPPPLEL